MVEVVAMAHVHSCPVCDNPAVNANIASRTVWCCNASCKFAFYAISIDAWEALPRRDPMSLSALEMEVLQRIIDNPTPAPEWVRDAVKARRRK